MGKVSGEVGGYGFVGCLFAVGGEVFEDGEVSFNCADRIFSGTHREFDSECVCFWKGGEGLGLGVRGRLGCAGGWLG